MSGSTCKYFIEHPAMEALGLEIDESTNTVNLTPEIVLYGVRTWNKIGQAIYLSRPWINRRIVEASYTSDANKIITLASTVSAVRAVKQVATVAGQADCPQWPQDQINAWINGNTLDTDHYDHLPEDSSGNKRILVDTASVAYKVLALGRWTKATIEAGYDSSNPTATPTDYRVITFPIEDAEPLLLEEMYKAFVRWDGENQNDNSADFIAIAEDNENQQQAMGQQIQPKYPMFSDTADMWS